MMKRTDPPPPTNGWLGPQNTNWQIVIVILVAVLCVLVFIVLIAFLFCYCKKYKRRRNSTDRTGDALPQNPPPYNHERMGDDVRAEVGMPGYRVPNQFQREPNRIWQIGCDGAEDIICQRPQQPVVIPRCHSHELYVPERRNAHAPVYNPAYEESSDDSCSIDRRQQSFPDDLRDLFVVTDRSKSMTVANKLIVSLTHKVGHCGDVLYLDNMGISLRVPRGAVKRGTSQLISLVLNWDLSDNPNMDKDQSLVSPVVYVGPHGLRLEKACTLSYRHCAFDPRHIRVMRSETELTSQKQWEAMCDRDDTQGACVLTQDECRLNIETFTLFTCIQTPLDNQPCKKWLQLAVFACPLRKNMNHHQIRVYFLNKTPCALQWAIQNEAQYGGKQVCPEKVFLFDGTERDMYTRTKYVSCSWNLVDIDNFEKVKFLKIWHGHCPHISLCYKRNQSGSRNASAELNIQLQLFQEQLEADGEKIVIQIAEDTTTPVCDSEMVCRRHHLDELILDVQTLSGSHDSRGPTARNIDVNGSSNEYNIVHDNTSLTNSSNGTADSNEQRSRLRVVITGGRSQGSLDDITYGKRIQKIPHQVRKQLKLLLDPRNAFGNDWQELASYLRLDACIPFLREKDSPTETILEVADCRGITLGVLRSILRKMNRLDAVQVLDDYISEQLPRRMPVENCDRGYTIYRGYSS